MTTTTTATDSLATSTLTREDVIRISQSQKMARDRSVLSDQQHVPVPNQNEIYVMGKSNLNYVRVVFYVVIFVEISLLALLFMTLFIWNSDLYSIPTVYLFLYLAHIPHLFAPFGLVAIVFDSINFYYMNMIAVVFGIAIFGDTIVVLWKSVCLNTTGDSFACPKLVHGQWLEWTTFAIASLFLISAIAAFVALVFYIRRMKFHINNYFNWLKQFQSQQTSIYKENNERISFQQPYQVYMARYRLRSLAGVDLFLFGMIVILRVVFFFGEGLWWASFLQASHIFLWLWILELSGSNEWKVPVYLGGTDASVNGTLADITMYIYTFTICVNAVTLVLCIVDLIKTFTSLSILEFLIGWLLFGLHILLLIYCIFTVNNLLKLTDHLDKYISSKIK